MAERPIIFSGPMVRAILDGRKTMTRRVLKPQPTDVAGLPVGWLWPEGSPFPRITVGRVITTQRMPYHVGQRLWVRETWCSPARRKGHQRGDQDLCLYAADHPGCDTPKWRPSIHMPRWASRLTLTVTDVRVQRLQDISEADAEAEGVFRHVAPHSINKVFRHMRGTYAINYFHTLWDSINAKRPGASWEDNPWVVAVGFTSEQRNIDAESEAA